MFSIEREPQPVELLNTDIQFKKEITGLNTKEAYEHYKKNRNRLKYNTDETKVLFKKMNYCRCSFCTEVINSFNKTMTIEHKQLKSTNPDKIFEWDNLLCSCKACNTIRSTKKYVDDLYLDPTKIKFVERYFKYDFNGKIKPNDSLDKNEIAKVEYMIDLYQLNREDLIYERRQFMMELLDDTYYEIFKKCDKFSKHIIFLGLFTYYMERRG